MKTFLLLPILLISVCTLKAQRIKGNFKADIGIGYAVPTEGFGVNPGVSFVLEPHVYLSDHFTAGLRLEGALLGYHPEYDDELFSFFGSTAVTGEYYFAKGPVRPFLGFGAGLFTRHYILEDYTGDELYTSDYGAIKLGFMGRAGFELGHIRITGSYNVIGANFSYSAVTVGYIIGD
ncbi:MAG TPA: hypothetical protein VHA56_15805 [Mucilaginibacter sp.]|nr:hypothetical protein [Mucilaginibacter sp.]